MIDKTVRVNERVRAREIRLIDEDGTQLGIMTPQEGLRLAQSKDQDLVEIAPEAKPPVCRIMNFGKFLYQRNKRAHEAKKHQKHVQVKEVKFRVKIDEHDYQFKKNHINRFLVDGNKVKATIMFRGRERAHRQLGTRILNRLTEDLAEVGQVEVGQRMEGNLMSLVFSPKKGAVEKAKRKAAAQKEPSAASATQPGGER
jgi:translation initiation factor IF-3